MTFIELLYFIVAIDSAYFAARWAYFRWGWILAILTFVFLCWPIFWFFFSGRFGKLVDFLFRQGKHKKKNSN